MPFAIQNTDVLQVTFEQRYKGQVCLNVIHYKQEDAAPEIEDGAGHLAALVGRLNTLLTGPIDKMAETQVLSLSYVRTTAQVVFPVRLPYYRENIDYAGQIDDPGLPPNSSAVITLQGEIAGRGKSGSKHLAGQPQGDQADGRWDAGHMVKLGEAAEAIRAPIDDNVLTGNIWYPILFTPGVGGLTNWVINAFEQREVRVMRRRTVGLGI